MGESTKAYAKRYLVIDILSNIITVIMLYQGDIFWVNQGKSYMNTINQYHQQS
jgi:hypothetical protein